MINFFYNENNTLGAILDFLVVFRHKMCSGVYIIEVVSQVEIV